MSLATLRFSLIILTFALTVSLSHAYIDLGGFYTTPTYIPNIPTPRPHQVRDLEYMSYIPKLPSMITAIAPSITMVDNGTYETLYSVHYHDYFVRSSLGKGVFKRGVFASDSPITTCTPCGGAAPTSTAVNTTTTGPTISCTVHSYYVGLLVSHFLALGAPTGVSWYRRGRR
jgi:hypothetical protein